MILYTIPSGSQYRTGIAVSDQPNGPYAGDDNPGYPPCDQPTPVTDEE